MSGGILEPPLRRLAFGTLPTGTDFGAILERHSAAG
jgi:hypothetical protein